ncbi:MAG TPA: MFS transporter [Gemmatimonadaceae bacterium]|nr:MFS transporter [Gemmatimonadaceae bacterium]
MPEIATRDGELWSTDAHAARAAVGRRLDVYGSFQAIMGQLTGGVFLTGYALALHAGNELIGLLAALPLAIKLTQLYTSWHIERAGHWKRSALRAAALSRGALLLAAGIPFAVASGSLASWLLVVIVAVSAFAGSIFDLAFLTWMAELIPASVRGAFLGQRSRVTGLVGQAVALAAAFGLDRWRQSHANAPDAFAILFGAGAVLGLIGLTFLGGVPVPRRKVSRVEEPSIVSTLTGPARDPNVRRLLEFVAVWHFSIGLVGPFFTVFMLQQLGLSFALVMAFSVVTNLTGSLTQAYWGKLGDHFGSKTALRAGTYLITFVVGLWLIVTPHRVWPIVLIQLISGFGWSAYNANLSNLVLKLAPEGHMPSYIASLGAVSGSAEAIGPIVGGVALTALRGTGVPAIDAFYALFATSLVLRAIATILPGFVREPGGAPVGHMVRVMARFRTMNIDMPFEPIFSYAFTHVARIADFIARERTDPPTRGRPAWASR